MASRNPIKPPRLALRIFKLYCGKRRYEELSGDLEEVFLHDIESRGLIRAKINFYWNVLTSFRSYARKDAVFISPQIDLYKNYFLSSWRRLKKEKGYTSISTAALVIGLTSFMLIGIYLTTELGFDKFYKSYDSIYRIVQISEDGGEVEHVGMSSIPLGESILSETTGVDASAMVWRGADGWIKHGDKEFYESKYLLATDQFFEIFENSFIYGNPEEPFTSPQSAVVTESFANKYFERHNVIGEYLESDRYGEFEISAVVKDLPGNTHLKYDFILSPYFSHYFEQAHPFFRRYFDSWYGHPATTYVAVRNEMHVNRLENQISEILEKNEEEGRSHYAHYLQKLADFHFYDHEVYSGVSRVPQGDKRKMATLTAISFLLLITSILNYLNLISARISRRILEMGVRKALGAGRSHMVFQSMPETLIVISISLIISVLLVYQLLPVFSLLVEKQLELNLSVVFQLGLILLPILMLAIVSTALYPAFLQYRQSRVPTSLLKPKTEQRNGIRNFLSIVQFLVASLMIVATTIIYFQTQLISNHDLGYRKENILMMEVNGGGVRANYNSMKAELLAHPDIEMVGAMNRAFSGFRDNQDVNFLTGEKALNILATSQSAAFYAIDEEIIPLLDIQLLGGRNFYGAVIDSSHVLINKAMVEYAFPGKSPSDIIGSELLYPDWNDTRVTIIGVVSNFNFEPLYSEVKPVILANLQSNIASVDDIAIKLNGSDMQSAIAHIDKLHKKYEPTSLMTLQFFDDMIESIYKDEKSYQQVFSSGSILTIVIAIIGLVGLTSYTSELRAKEFGIRKVFGASINQILKLQSTSLIKLLIFAQLLSTPIVILWAQNWLNGYAYSIGLSPVYFFIGALVMIAISLMTVIIVSYRVASMRPVKSLRSE